MENKQLDFEMALEGFKIAYAELRGTICSLVKLIVKSFTSLFRKFGSKRKSKAALVYKTTKPIKVYNVKEIKK